MNCSHRRSDEPLNMTAVMRPPHRAVGQFDPVFLRSTHECMGVKFLGIVEMNSIWDPGNRPLQRVEPAIREPSVLRQYALREDRCYGDDARRLQRKIETRHAPCCHVDGERDPGAAYRQSILFIENDQIYGAVIDPKKLEGKSRLIIYLNWSECLTGSFRPEASSRNFFRIVCRKSSLDRTIIWNWHAASPTFLRNNAYQGGN